MLFSPFYSFFIRFLKVTRKSPDGLIIPIFSIKAQIMAQKATIHKVELSVSDMDRHYYETHTSDRSQTPFRNG